MEDLPRYPGLGMDLDIAGNDVSHWPAHFQIGMTEDPGAKSDILPIREVVMMLLMDTLTDKDGWDEKIFDDTIVARWKAEAMTQDEQDLYNFVVEGRDLELLRKPTRIMSETAFDFCVQELRDKAAYYHMTGIIPTLDATSTIAKSDTIMPADLRDELEKAFMILKLEQNTAPDWHPQSSDLVQDLLHPSMYPFVYGRSRVFRKPCVGVDNAIKKWAGKGDIAPRISDPYLTEYRRLTTVGRMHLSPALWSDMYQWLPSNISLQSDGKVQIASYINNLHPIRHKSIYQTVERCIAVAIPMWDQVLRVFKGHEKLGEAGRDQSRFDKPQEYIDDYNCPGRYWHPTRPDEQMDQEIAEMRQASNNEENPPAYERWLKEREAIQLEPRKFEEVDYTPTYTLMDNFRQTGIQVIVKMASIELTPDKPEFPEGNWHLEGQVNERICATALYYLGCENITDSYLSFRQETNNSIGEEFNYAQGYGCLQNYGRVATRKGRMIAFPNTLQHRVSLFRLADPTKPGYRSFIALWLVDPHIPIISTANVPPQQQSWWLEETLGHTASGTSSSLDEVLSVINFQPAEARNDTSRLPMEIVAMIRNLADYDELPMTEEEARRHRDALMRERIQSREDQEWGLLSNSYNFCEH